MIEVSMTGIIDNLKGSFLGGVHPDYSKKTSDKKIEEAKLPEEVVIPLRQHVGAICESLVEEGEEVKVGQKIGESDSLSSPVHATVSGTVTDISPKMTPNCVEIPCVTIEADGEDDWVEMEGIDPEEASREEIVEKVKNAGVAGLGGASFPTHIKLRPPEEKNIDTVLVNGAECEPYITADDRLMQEEGEKILKGSRLVKKAVDADRIIIGIEDNKPKAIENLRSLSSEGTEVVSVETIYPQGDEYHLIKSILDREIPEGGLPFDAGVAVQNVGTLKSIYDAVYKGKPMVERVLTVTGGVKNPKNLRARFGTYFSSLIEQCGGVEGEIRKLIAGGPMMGNTQNQDVPTVKGTNCILVFNDEIIEEIGEERDCIRCSSCVDACPMNLMPFKFWQLVQSEEYEKAEEFDIMSCDECGSCAYVCPAKIPLVEYIQEGKEELESSEE